MEVNAIQSICAPFYNFVSAICHNAAVVVVGIVVVVAAVAAAVKSAFVYNCVDSASNVLNTTRSSTLACSGACQMYFLRPLYCHARTPATTLSWQLVPPRTPHVSGSSTRPTRCRRTRPSVSACSASARCAARTRPGTLCVPRIHTLCCQHTHTRAVYGTHTTHTDNNWPTMPAARRHQTHADRALPCADRTTTVGGTRA
jgi:hypothetical protein